MQNGNIQTHPKSYLVQVNIECNVQIYENQPPETSRMLLSDDEQIDFSLALAVLRVCSGKTLPARTYKSDQSKGHKRTDPGAHGSDKICNEK